MAGLFKLLYQSSPKEIFNMDSFLCIYPIKDCPDSIRHLPKFGYTFRTIRKNEGHDANKMTNELKWRMA